MNRIISHLPKIESTTQGHSALRAERRLKKDVKAMLHEIAFVLEMTRRVKTQMLNEKEMSETLAV